MLDREPDSVLGITEVYGSKALGCHPLIVDQIGAANSGVGRGLLPLEREPMRVGC
jgi:hypothetical protein